MRMHAGDKPHKCSLGDKRFIRHSDLTSHMKTHTGDKPYKCNLCYKSFCRVYSRLTIPKKAHTVDEPHACTICDKIFIENGVLNQHMKTHTSGDKPRPHKCTICEKVLVQPPIHMSTHMNTLAINPASVLYVKKGLVNLPIYPLI